MIKAIDLFAGAGGFSEGARLAGIQVVWAANHWEQAIRVHAQNHPDTQHLCQDLHQANWADVPRHDILLAAPACQGHSRARGKERDHHDTCRSTAWAVVSATEYHRPRAVVVENVAEFRNWALYPSWRGAMTALGYSCRENVIDAADHAVPQNRVRLFMVFTKTLSPMDIQLKKSDPVAAASFIDFSSGKWSRVLKNGRSEATIERWKSGRLEFGDRFVAPFYGNSRTGRDLNRPIGTITTRDRWVVFDGDLMRMLTVAECKAAMGFSSDYIIPEKPKRLGVHLLGNAVCPPVARDLLSEVVRYL